MNNENFNGLLMSWSKIMAENKEYLIKLDGVVGDSDLGLTMSDGFNAAYEDANNSTQTDIGKLLYFAGKAMANKVPSTMGTLMASGIMEMGKFTKGEVDIDEKMFVETLYAFVDGVVKRGKAKIGEKTFLDGFLPGVDALQISVENEEGMLVATEKAYDASVKGFNDTATMIAVHGRAATRGEQSRALLDPGACVGMLLFEGLLRYVTQIN